MEKKALFAGLLAGIMALSLVGCSKDKAPDNSQTPDSPSQSIEPQTPDSSNSPDIPDVPDMPEDDSVFVLHIQDEDGNDLPVPAEMHYSRNEGAYRLLVPSDWKQLGGEDEFSTSVSFGPNSETGPSVVLSVWEDSSLEQVFSEFEHGNQVELPEDAAEGQVLEVQNEKGDVFAVCLFADGDNVVSASIYAPADDADSTAEVLAMLRASIQSFGPSPAGGSGELPGLSDPVAAPGGVAG